MRYRNNSTRSPLERAARALSSLVAFALLVTHAPVAGLARRAPRAAAPDRAAVAHDLARLPLSFTPNAGQLDASVKYQMRTPGGTVSFMEREVAYRLPAPRGVVRRKGEPPLLTSIDLRVRFEGANARPSVAGEGRLPGTVSYFIGSDPSRWRASLPTYESVVYRQLYKGIDLSYGGAGGHLKSTYTVAPGADPSRIRWSYEGATGVRVDERSGDLRVSLPTNVAQLAAASKSKEGAGREAKNSAPHAAQVRTAKPGTAQPHSPASPAQASDVQSGVPASPARANAAQTNVLATDAAQAKAAAPEVVERAPLVWQELGGRRVFVQARYEVAADGSVGFALGHYDRARPLIIDPDIEWSYFVGGAGNDYGYSVALDSAGNIYVAGVTSSADFPQSAPPGVQPIPGHKIDAFVVKLNPTGDTILYSTFLGGDEDDCAFGITLDPSGNAHVTGYTRSANFPTANALQAAHGGGNSDAFAAKLSADGRTLLYSTYLGGADEDVARAVTISPDGQACLTGYTRSANFPTANALQAANAGMEDAFVLKLGADGAAVTYGTYLGGAQADYGEAVAVDAQGAVHVAGSTESADFPTASAGQGVKGAADDAFAAKLAPGGGALLYSTFIGGGDSDFARAAALDRFGNLYVAGFTRSNDFPTANAFQPAHAGGDDAFVVRLRPDGATRFSTYLGGSGDDNAFGVAVDRGGYVTLAGRTKSPNFPVRNPPPDGAIGPDRNDVFVSRLVPGGQGLHFSTYIGGNGHEMAEGVALDPAGNAYVTGYTFSDEGFPNPETDPQGGLLDEEMFILKIAEPTPPLAPCQATSNVALAASGATASASSVNTDRDYSPSGANDGDRTGHDWERGGGWNDATRDQWPDWLEVDFGDLKRISQISVYTLQDNFHRPQEPTPLTTTSFYGLFDFEVQYWDGAGWANLGSVNGNRLVINTFVFPEVDTPKIRVRVTNARAHYSRIVEVEALGCPAP